MADFDAIVVGAGCAGSVAAYELAKAGKEVLLIERGNFAGAKNPRAHLPDDAGGQPNHGLHVRGHARRG